MLRNLHVRQPVCRAPVGPSGGQVHFSIKTRWNRSFSVSGLRHTFSSRCWSARTEIEGARAWALRVARARARLRISPHNFSAKSSREIADVPQPEGENALVPRGACYLKKRERKKKTRLCIINTELLKLRTVCVCVCVSVCRCIAFN